MHERDEDMSAEAYRANLQKYMDTMRREFPDPLPIIGVDHGSEPSTSVIAVKCARCSTVLSTNNEADPTPLVEAHKAKCFVVGDYVRWEPVHGGPWVEGPLCLVEGAGLVIAVERTGNDAERFGWRVGRPGGTVAANVRRVPRPGQDVEASGTVSHRCQGYTPDGQCPERTTEPHRLGTWNCPAHAGQVDPVQAGHTTVTYDGLTALDCYMKWSDNRAIVERGGKPLYAMTPNQIAVGRAAYQADALNEHAAELRAKVAASAEVERCKVRVQIQDDED